MKVDTGSTNFSKIPCLIDLLPAFHVECTTKGISRFHDKRTGDSFLPPKMRTVDERIFFRRLMHVLYSQFKLKAETEATLAANNATTATPYPRRDIFAGCLETKEIDQLQC